MKKRMNKLSNVYFLKNIKICEKHSRKSNQIRLLLIIRMTIGLNWRPKIPCIYSENELEHTAHVRKIIQRLQKTSLQIDIKKCEFNTKRTKYFGFIINIEGIEMDFEKIEMIIIWQISTTVKKMQFFFYFYNFYCRFIREYE
jgi:hypothetical protein